MTEGSNRTVLITGAAGNLGRAVAAGFAAQGARLALMDVTEAALEDAYPGESDGRLKLAVDLLDPGAVETAVDRVARNLGGPQVLCALVGGFHMGEPVHEMPADKWDLMLNLNARTLINSVQAVVPRMLDGGGGKIVTVGAGAARQGMAKMGAYIAAKSAVIRLTESMAAELREKGINVNCVLPSIIDTPQNRAAMPDADPKRWVTPEKLAAVIAFLASEDASAMNGAAVPVVGLS